MKHAFLIIAHNEYPVLEVLLSAQRKFLVGKF